MDGQSNSTKPQPESFEFLEYEVVKILLIGDAMVGKTSFINRYVNNEVSDAYKCTIGWDYMSKIVPRPNSCLGSNLKLQLWDIAGQERFPLLTRAYYRYVRGCIVMFDITEPHTFHNAQKWKRSLDMNTEAEYGYKVPCMLVANKVDLSDHKVSYDEVDSFCRKFEFSQWTMTSSKEGTMVQETVNYLIDLILKRSPTVYEPMNFELVNDNVVNLRVDEGGNKASSCCVASVLGKLGRR